MNRADDAHAVVCSRAKLGQGMSHRQQSRQIRPGQHREGMCRSYHGFTAAALHVSGPITCRAKIGLGDSEQERAGRLCTTATVILVQYKTNDKATEDESRGDVPVMRRSYGYR